MSESTEQQPEQDASTDGGEDRGVTDSDEAGEVTDEMLPEDLQPTEDNPLARHPGQTGDDDDLIGAGGDEERARNPSASMGYSSAGASDEGGDAAEDEA